MKFRINPLSERELRGTANLLTHTKNKATQTLLGDEYLHNEFKYYGTNVQWTAG